MSVARSKYREASHAGSWYSGDATTLDNQLTQWISKAAGSSSQNGARAIIAPHAGYSYSGPTAAFAYHQVDPSKVNKVFILGPSHRVHLRGCALTSTNQYETPLYDLTVDRKETDTLYSSGHFEWMSLQTDEEEHSIELHLPYVAKVMSSKKGKYTVIPVLVGSLSREKEKLYGELFAPYLSDPANLFVISSDFCHWGKRFSYTFYEDGNGTISQHIEKLDRMGMEHIEKLDSESFHQYLKQYRNTICGRHPIGVLLSMIDSMRQHSTNGHQLSFKFLHYAQSGQCLSKNDSSVSYAAGALTIS